VSLTYFTCRAFKKWADGWTALFLSATLLHFTRRVKVAHSSNCDKRHEQHLQQQQQQHQQQQQQHQQSQQQHSHSSDIRRLSGCVFTLQFSVVRWQTRRQRASQSQPFPIRVQIEIRVRINIRVVLVLQGFCAWLQKVSHEQNRKVHCMQVHANVSFRWLRLRTDDNGTYWVYVAPISLSICT